MRDEPGPLHEIVYVSRIAASVRPDAVAEIVIQARHKNQRLGLTGCLVYAGAHLAQFVEGPPDAVLPLLERITSDPRHYNFRLLRSRPVAKRRLSHWSMRLLLRDDVEKSILAIGLDASTEPRRVDEIIASLFAGTANSR